MKKKTFIILILIVFIIFLIYIKTKDNIVYYVNLTDEHVEHYGTRYSSNILEELQKQNKLEEFIEFEYDDYRITDLTKAIRDNAYIYVGEKKHTIQNALIKADLLTINIGKNDIEYGLLKENKEEIYNYLDTLLIDLETLLTEVKKYTKEQIMVIGYYTIDEKKVKYIEYFNLKAEKLCNKKEIKFISIDKNNIERLSNQISSNILTKFTFP